MIRLPVVSSQIHSIGYDLPSQTMEIEFTQHNPAKPRSVYLYQNVPPEIFIAFRAAPSIGSYFGKVIKPYPEKFPYQKIA